MNIKKTLNFTELRKHGFNSLDLKGDEVILVANKKGNKCIVSQEYLHTLIEASNNKIKHPSFNSQVVGLSGSNFDSIITERFENFETKVLVSVNEIIDNKIKKNNKEDNDDNR